MKTHLFKTTLLSVCTLLIAACTTSEEKNTPPGLWIEQTSIATFPTDELSIVGTASNYVGISSINLKCENWSVDYTYDLNAQKPRAFNFDYRFTVPQTAEFANDIMVVTVRDVNGLETTGEIHFEFLPDQIAPTAEPALPAQISVEFDALTETSGTWTLSLNLYDRRGLKNAVVNIPTASIEESVDIAAGTDTYLLEKTYQLPAGTHAVTVSVYDLVGNKLELSSELVVMPAEEEDPISKYPQMFLVMADEDPDDYLDGYYIHMDRDYDDTGAAIDYAYEGKFYAAAGAGLYIVPTESMDGDIFGVSPYVSTKLMNKKDYVKPITIETAGYYGIWINIQDHEYSIWPLEIPTATACEEDVWISGTGFSSFADWSTLSSAMTRDGYVHTCTAGVEAGTVEYYFYTDAWARVFRADENGYWWYESGSGGTAKFSSDYAGDAVFTFDSILPYATVKKSQTTNE